MLRRWVLGCQRARSLSLDRTFGHWWRGVSWDVDVGDGSQELPMPGPVMSQSRTVRGRVTESATPSASTSRPDTETEDVADVEMETRASDTVDVDLDAHTIINTNAADDGVSDGIVALDQNVNDNLAMGAPPGAPAAIDAAPRTRANTVTLNTRNMTREHYHHHGHAHGREELTPRAVLASLPMRAHVRPLVPVRMFVGADGATTGPTRTSPARSGTAGLNLKSPVQATRGALALPAPAAASPSLAAPVPTPRATYRYHYHHHHYHLGVEEPGPFREEDVLLSVQLLAYLSKYPHCGHAVDTSYGCWSEGADRARKGEGEGHRDLSGLNPPSPTSPSSSASPRMTNVFSLVKRFTTQYWAGVIMRNACRKDKSRGGITSFPQEFAKCLRCKNANYCRKECQSRGWNGGRRFWCSAREGDDIAEGRSGVGQEGDGDSAEGAVVSVDVGSGSGAGGRTVSTVAHDMVERRLAWDRECQRLASAAAAALAGMQPVARFSVTRNNGKTTASEFARPRGASGHGHARVAGLPSASSNTIAPANSHTAARSSSRRTIIDNDNIILSKSCGFTLDGAYTRERLPSRQSGAERVLCGGTGDYLQLPSAVGMSVVEAPADDGAGYAAALDVDIEAHIATFERMRAGERALPDRIQALEPEDRDVDLQTSSSSSSRSLDFLISLRMSLSDYAKTLTRRRRQQQQQQQQQQLGPHPDALINRSRFTLASPNNWKS
ncbi:hypothetical protein DFH11DRAFT_1879273 [Phellopilus nigrolimitatus]|nr:hypothetical protein DFH11DRAFT_1879273 [Phellopilus nigrolimitatus]